MSEPVNALQLGQKVRIRSTGELGVVAWLWQDGEDCDTYVAVFGKQFPVNRPESKPAILRYAAISLEPINE